MVILYQRASDYRKPGQPQYTKVTFRGAKPQTGTGYGSRGIGYAAVEAPWNAETSPQDLLKPTLAQFEQTADYQTGISGASFTLVTSLTAITGPYDEVMAAYEARRDADRRKREQDQARRDAVHARAADIISQLARFGAEPVSAGTSCAQPHIKLTLDDAEKLLALLEGSRATEA